MKGQSLAIEFTAAACERIQISSAVLPSFVDQIADCKRKKRIEEYRQQHRSLDKDYR